MLKEATLSTVEEFANYLVKNNKDIGHIIQITAKKLNNANYIQDGFELTNYTIKGNTEKAKEKSFDIIGSALGAAILGSAGRKIGGKYLAFPSAIGGSVLGGTESGREILLTMYENFNENDRKRLQESLNKVKNELNKEIMIKNNLKNKSQAENLKQFMSTFDRPKETNLLIDSDENKTLIIIPSNE